MAVINLKDAENIYNEPGKAARRKEARKWRDTFTAKEILEAVDELPDDLGEEQPKSLPSAQEDPAILYGLHGNGRVACSSQAR